jgi:hypothetical protein
MTKHDLYKFTSTVYRKLRDKTFTVKFIRDKKLCGQCYIGEKWIELNPHMDVISTLIHEMLHDINPLMTEKQVLAQEKLIMNQLSHKQLVNLMVALGKALKRTHKKKA